MARKTVYRDYRPGKRGQFSSKAAFNRSQSQGVKCHIHREYVYDSISSIDELFDIQDDDDLDYEEFHGTGNTGRIKA